ncbi:hypothetical protein [Bacillus sp. X1(2014)]|uniref:hypothetical protein n=1 Tax=Bacillus sp. X1(2014) TaxID=1565991 RepID=UPI0016433024|nr:hypothetical protein [Bacillus sp. X1(2014)]
MVQFGQLTVRFQVFTAQFQAVTVDFQTLTSHKLMFTVQQAPTTLKPLTEKSLQTNK